jgi:hypothetical protein
MRKTIVAATAALVVAGAGLVFTQGGAVNLVGGLSGYSEVPVVSSTGRGLFRAAIGAGDQSIAYDLRYTGLEGEATQAHIHVGATDTNGGISVWLCGAGSAANPVCPTPSGVVTGTITSADVIGPASQGIAQGELDELIAAIRFGKAYVNVHSTTWTGGEIRAQITPVPAGSQHEH